MLCLCQLHRYYMLLKLYYSCRYQFIEHPSFNKPLYNTLFIYKIYMRAKAVFEVSESSSIHHLIEVHKRIRNIIKDSEILPVSESFLVEPEEKILFEIINETKSGTEKLLRDNKYIEACSNFIDMKPVVDNFFEKIEKPAYAVDGRLLFSCQEL